LDAVEVSAGSQHTCALLADATVRCWGLNFDGELGDGTNMGRARPVPVVDLP
jgi:alpha-tubulin suppressor-like RCC1 family protein